jgi:hypothetical protein
MGNYELANVYTCRLKQEINALASINQQEPIFTDRALWRAWGDQEVGRPTSGACVPMNQRHPN